MNIVWLSLSVLLWGLVHSLLASLKAKSLAHRLLGSVSDRLYRLGYNLFAGASLLPTAWLLFSLPDRLLYVIPPPWIILSVAGQFLAVALLAIGVLQTGALSFLGLAQLISTEQQSSKLVVAGLYRHVRHPLYVAGLVFIWLLPRMTVNWLAVIASASVYILLGAWFEERKLRREFGEAYLSYAAETPMFIPFLKLKRQRNP